MLSPSTSAMTSVLAAVSKRMYTSNQWGLCLPRNGSLLEEKCGRGVAEGAGVAACVLLLAAVDEEDEDADGVGDVGDDDDDDEDDAAAPKLSGNTLSCSST